VADPIPCPVDGCDLTFPDEAATAEHMKTVHKEAFSAVVEPIEELPEAPVEAIEIPGLGAVPPEALQFVNTMMDMKIKAALEAERPVIKAAVSESIKTTIAQIRAAGIPIPEITGDPPAAGAGSQVTPAGLEVMKMIMGMGGGGSDIESMTKALTQMRAIADLMSPQTPMDKLMPTIVVRSLFKGGLLTETEKNTLEKDIGA